jgi:hypothetical protein
LQACTNDKLTPSHCHFPGHYQVGDVIKGCKISCCLSLQGTALIATLKGVHEKWLLTSFAVTLK